MNVRRVFLDIELLYNGDAKSRQLMFRDFDNWKFVIDGEYEGVYGRYYGIIGMLIIDCDFDKETNTYRITDKEFVQMVGPDITKDNLIKTVGEFNEIIHYHGRSTPNHKGYIGFDLPVIDAQLGIALDMLPGVKSIDVELYCHRNGIYGGQKAAERVFNIERESNVDDGSDAVILMINAGRAKDDEQRKLIFDKLLKYNKEDIRGLVVIEQAIRGIKYQE